MSASLLLYQYAIVSQGGKKTEIGFRDIPTVVTVGDTKIELEKTLTANTTWDVWGHSSEDAFTAFKIAFFESDVDGALIELTCDKGAEVGTEEFVLELKAGIPLIIASNVSYANHTADFATGTADVIDRIRARVPSGGSTAQVRATFFPAAS